MILRTGLLSPGVEWCMVRQGYRRLGEIRVCGLAPDSHFLLPLSLSVLTHNEIPSGVCVEGKKSKLIKVLTSFSSTSGDYPLFYELTVNDDWFCLQRRWVSLLHSWMRMRISHFTGRD